MSDLSEYYLGSSPSVMEIELLEIEHFRFDPTVFRFCSNASHMDLSSTDAFGNPKRGVIVTHEGGAGPFEYEFAPIKIEKLGSGTDMDQSLRVTLGDVGEELPQQLDRVDFFNANTVKPTVRYRTYRSDNLTAPLTEVPVILEIKRVMMSKQGSAFEAVSPYLNVGRTGIVYTVRDFPTMKAFFRNR